MKRCRKIQKVIVGGGKAGLLICCLGNKPPCCLKCSLSTDSVSHDTWTHRFLQSVSFWMTPSYDLHTACGDSPLHVFNTASISLIWWSCRWFYHHGCVFAGDTASPANTQQIKNSACLLSLQPLDCSMIHPDNSREETAGTTLNARLCCCTLFTSLHTW